MSQAPLTEPLKRIATFLERIEQSLARIEKQMQDDTPATTDLRNIVGTLSCVLEDQANARR